MSSFHQMGHDSENLLFAPELSGYSGAVLSPVNYDEVASKAQAEECTKRGLQCILDPQLYLPQSDRGQLRTWSHFPSDVDTADLSSDSWWARLAKRLAKTAKSVGVSGVCSPAALPRSYTDSFYAGQVRSCELLKDQAGPLDVEVFQTALVSLPDLALAGRPEEVASILSRTASERVYLILVAEEHPRREVIDVESLKGAMRLIHFLSIAGLFVLVAYCSSDMLLWKHAGAKGCASGKFFNLRRFSRARFEEPGVGGGQLPYWFEENLVAFLRESDLVRVQREGLLSDSSLRNPFGTRILASLKTEPGRAWLGLSWRQYLWWFADAERRVASGELPVPDLLVRAEGNWETLERKGVLMEEPQNDRRWLRPWRRAVNEFA